MKPIPQSQPHLLPLLQVEILKTLPYSKLATLAGAVTLTTYSPGDRIVKKGDKGDIFYMIKTGTVLVTEHGNGDGGKLKYSGGDYFGER